MLQAYMPEPGKICYHEVDVPPVGKHQLKLKMHKIGVCGSDIHVWHGRHPYTSYPVVQGHEVTAVVEEVGSAVEGFLVGDMVTVQPQVVCGKCYPCTHGMYNDCNELKVMGFQTTGMASEYFVVDAEKCLVVPKGISMDYAAMIEPLAVAVHAVRRFGDPKGRKAFVIGGGPIGNLVAQVLIALGAEKVLLSEVSEYRLNTAQQCGIQTMDPTKISPQDAVFEQFGPDQADVIFECVGNANTVQQTIELARKGSDIIIVGVVPDLCSVNMGFVQDHELRISGTAMYRVEDYREAIELITNDRIRLDLLITHHVPFRQYADAYHLVETEKDKVMKIIIDFD